MREREEKEERERTQNTRQLRAREEIVFLCGPKSEHLGSAARVGTLLRSSNFWKRNLDVWYFLLWVLERKVNLSIAWQRTYVRRISIISTRKHFFWFCLQDERMLSKRSSSDCLWGAVKGRYHKDTWVDVRVAFGVMRGGYPCSSPSSSCFV